VPASGFGPGLAIGHRDSLGIGAAAGGSDPA
jgi:hypothetical protein